MAIAFPTLASGRLFDIRSELIVRYDFETIQYGGGFISTKKTRINNVDRTYRLIIPVLDQTDADTLQTFLNDRRDGQNVIIELLSIDNTGSTTSEFKLVEYKRDNRDGGNLNNFTIIAEEAI